MNLNFCLFVDGFTCLHFCHSFLLNISIWCVRNLSNIKYSCERERARSFRKKFVFDMLSKSSLCIFIHFFFIAFRFSGDLFMYNFFFDSPILLFFSFYSNSVSISVCLPRPPSIPVRFFYFII